MKKRNVINLIKYHVEKNEPAFRTEAYEIAHSFDNSEDYQLAQYIMGLLSEVNTFSPQQFIDDLAFLRHVEAKSDSLPLPEEIKNNLLGMMNAVKHQIGMNKFLFQGAPGTGKTESAKQVARILEYDLYIVDFSSLIDCKLGQTAKNIALLFEEISHLANRKNLIVLFDEIDAIAIDRINANDLREMGRATSAVLKGLDELDERVVLIATTNLFEQFDKALLRRFDATIDFNVYSREDLVDIAEMMLSSLLSKFKSFGRNMRLFKKIINLMEEIPYPGELKNLIKTSLAFSSPNVELDYLKKLFEKICPGKKNLDDFVKLGFTLREIEVLTGVSKSQVARVLKEYNNE